MKYMRVERFIRCCAFGKVWRQSFNFTEVGVIFQGVGVTLTTLTRTVIDQPSLRETNSSALYIFPPFSELGYLNLTF